MVQQREPVFEPKRTSIRIEAAHAYDIDLLAQSIGEQPADIMRMALNVGLARMLQIVKPDSRFYPQLMEQTEAAIVTVESHVQKVVLSRGT